MAMRSTRTAITGFALGAALSLLGTVGSAHAAVQGATTTVQANSNLRGGASSNSEYFGTTRVEAEAAISCFTYGQYVKVGNYGTDVWYQGNVFEPTHAYLHVWIWGGNVNVGADPAPGIDHC